MNASDLTCCFVDHGLFLPFARKLGQFYKRVLYYTPWEKGFPALEDCVVGDGFPDVERVESIWDHKVDVDLFVFPDIQHAGLQRELISQGYPVWGSRGGDELELDRGLFLKTLREIGLEVPPHTEVQGVTALRDFLRDKDDYYIKVSKFRGSMETWHWRGWALDEGELDDMAVNFGSAKDLVSFYCFPNIDTPLEVGYDGYCIHGQFPRTGVQGYECKDKGFLCHAQPYDQLPQQVREVNEAFGPVLGKHGYRNFFSSEIRIKEDKAFFIDPCCRCPSPSTEAQLELYGNLGDIVWAGAHGVLVEPELTAAYAAECVLKAKREKGRWLSVEADPEIEPHLKFHQCCRIDGLIRFPPEEPVLDEVGWLVATGNSPKEAVDNLVELAGKCPDGVCPQVEALADLIKEIDDAQAKGIKFTKLEMPEPADVLE